MFATSTSVRKYPAEVQSAVIDLLAECPIPRDALPYTDEFTGLKSQFEGRTGLTMEDAEFWQALSSIGKGGGAAGKGGRKRALRTRSLSHAQQLEILRLMPEGIGSRDQLPYTPLFDHLHRRFSRLTNTKLTRHEFWRALSRVAKRSRKPKPLFEAAPLGGLSRELVQFLQGINPWWRAEPSVPIERFQRWAFHEALRRLDAKIAPVVAIRGPRQVGKTTIQHQLIEYFLRIRRVRAERILRVQFDDVPAIGSLVHPVETIVRWYEENVLCEPINAVANRGEDVYLLFDELQNLPRWSAQLKALADHVSARILVTGSSALRIVRGRESLAGRVSTIELGPLRLYEIAGIRSLGDLPPYAMHAAIGDWSEREFWLELGAHAKRHAKVLNESFRFFSRFGGYPLCHRPAGDDPSLFGPQLVDFVVDKTIDHDPLATRRRSQADRRLIRETFRLICRYAGQAVRHNRIAQEIGDVLQTAVKVDAVADAVQFLADAMLIHQVPPLEMLLKKHGHPPKLCLCDHFVRNAWLQETIPIDPGELRQLAQSVSAVAGHIAESAIGYYLMGVPGLELAWFPARGKERELDFVVTIGTRRIPLEIKYQRGSLGPEDWQGIQGFCGKKHYEASFGLVITQNTCREISDTVIALPAKALLLVK